MRWMTGPGGYCSPRHRMPFNSKSKVTKALDDMATNICQAPPPIFDADPLRPRGDDDVMSLE